VPGVRTVSTGGCESGKCRIVGGMNKHKGVNRNTHRDQPRARSPTKSHWTGKTHGFIQYKYFENNPTVTTSNPPSCQWGVAATITDEAASSLPSQPKRRAIYILMGRGEIVMVIGAKTRIKMMYEKHVFSTCLSCMSPN